MVALRNKSGFTYEIHVKVFGIVNISWHDILSVLGMEGLYIGVYG